MRWLATLALALAVSGCLTDDRASRDRGTSGLFDSAQTIVGPKTPRCSKYAKSSSSRAPCDEAQYLAEAYTRRLSTGDDVCIEGGYGDEQNRHCLARATVMDTATDKLLIEIKEAKPDSHWFQKEHHQFWFEESALVDLYLNDRGY